MVITAGRVTMATLEESSWLLSCQRLIKAERLPGQDLLLDLCRMQLEVSSSTVWEWHHHPK